jgi:hypothetical protein
MVLARSARPRSAPETLATGACESERGSGGVEHDVGTPPSNSRAAALAGDASTSERYDESVEEDEQQLRRGS